MRAVDNPPNRFLKAHVEWDGRPPDARLEVYEQQIVQALSRNDAFDLPFDHSCNPYRGCYHACSYCYARPSHQYLDLGAGSDFERKLIVKTNIVERLRAAFDRDSWRGERVCFSGNTDCYQPLEASYRLTRACLQVCLAYRNPVSIITKGALVARDLDVLAALAAETDLVVMLSIPYADDETGRAIEPHASPVSKRFSALQQLSEAGIETGVAIAPVIAGLNDRSIPTVLERARDAGARSAFLTPLRLDPQVEPYFFARLRETMPEAAARIEHAAREVRGGDLKENRPGLRMQGQGPRWRLAQDVFELHAKRLGLSTEQQRPQVQTFQRPQSQLSLF